MSRGRIEKALSGFYYVNTGAETLQCRARGKFRREGVSPLVGDRVEVRELGGGEGFVEAIEERRNVFSRPAAANIDQLVILASAAIPVTEPYLIDRIASIAALKGCDVLLCLNKCDLDPAEELYGIYSRSAIPVLRISAETGEGLDALRQAIAGKLNAFTGNSGVGKSSVLNALLPELHLPVGEVSKALGRGRHTTRHVELFPLGGGTYVIDTPGFSSFDTEEMDLELKEHLPETDFSMPKFIEDVKRIYKETGNCIVAVSEGIHYENGDFVSEAKVAANDGFGHAQLGGLATILAEVLKEETGAKVRGIELNLLQRCAAHLASETDIEESYMAGKVAVENAVNGINGRMIGFERGIQDGKYACRTKLIPLMEVANVEKKIPREWINEAGNGVNHQFIEYALPLIQGEPDLPKQDSLPRFAKLKKVLAK